MMALTHAAIAATGVSFALGDVSPLVIGFGILGSQLPDIDTSSSLIGQILFPVSRWIEDRYPHRSITHSFLATGAIALASVPLYLNFGWKAWIALSLGHLLACFSDTFTKQGVQLFFPSPVWCVCGSNPNRRLTTGSPSEYWVLAGAIALLLVNYHLIVSGGGIVQTASQQLGLKDGLIEVYNRKAASHHVWASIEGVRADDRSPVSGKFLILGTEGSEFIVTDGKGIYKTGEHIITNKINTGIGRPAGTEIKTLTFNDEEAIARLSELRNSIDNGLIYLTGSLTIDFPDEIKLPTVTGEYQRIALSGSVLKLNYQSIEEAIELLHGQFAVGTLTAKIVRPSPEFTR